MPKSTAKDQRWSAPRLAALTTLLAVAFGAGSATATSPATSEATGHLVKAIQVLEAEIKARPADEHRKKALGLLLRARSEILKADDTGGKPAPSPAPSN